MRRTPLYDAHVQAGARLVNFHGWEMPVQYVGILDEARQVRRHAGIFDLSHMGRLVITGPDRERFVDHVFSANLGKLKVGRAKYGFFLNEQGYPIDDVIAYRDQDTVHIVINGGNREADHDWVTSRLEASRMDARLRNVSDDQAMIAIQGPDSEATLQPLCSADLSAVPYYGFTNARVCDVPTLIARTGYTGEDGFEVFPEKSKGRMVWDAMLGAGKPFGVMPIGLGARDTLRLEAGMPLYGNELDLESDPIEAGLEFGLDLTKEGTIGIPALRARKAKGPAKRLVGFVAHTPRVARQGSAVFEGTRRVGKVASGTSSPTLGKSIGTAFVPPDRTDVGRTLSVEIRGTNHPLEVVPLPFYKRPPRRSHAPAARVP